MGQCKVKAHKRKGKTVKAHTRKTKKSTGGKKFYTENAMMRGWDIQNEMRSRSKD